MFRRISSIPSKFRVVSTRFFAEEVKVIQSKDATASAKTSVGRAFILATSFGILSLHVSLSWYTKEVISSRKYVTDADMHEYRSQPRNILKEKWGDEARGQFLMISLEVDKKVIEIAKERKPTLSAETVAKLEKEASSEFWTHYWGNFSFNKANADRNMDKFLKFYYTYLEREEEKKLNAELEAAEASKSNKA